MADSVDANPTIAGKWGDDVPLSTRCTEESGSDTVDAGPIGQAATGGTEAMETGDQQSVYEYNMRHKKRGLFVIVNNKDFHKKTGMNGRNGTDVDAANLYQRFKELGFEVHIFHNRTCTEMRKIMIEASQYSHKDCDAFGCAILSHGDNGVVYGTDGIVKLDDLCAPFKGDRCPTLAGKPKLFFIQACRGSELDHGAEVADADSEGEDETYSAKKIYRIPAEADFFYAYSTVPGYFSWRNSTKGSWFCQALNLVLKEHAASRDLLWMMTRVNNMVAFEFESNASKEFMNRKKQIPSIVSQLTRDVYFRVKH